MSDAALPVPQTNDASDSFVLLQLPVLALSLTYLSRHPQNLTSEHDALKIHTPPPV